MSDLTSRTGRLNTQSIPDSKTSQTESWADAELKNESIGAKPLAPIVSGSLEISKLSEDEFAIHAKTDLGESVSARAKIFAGVSAFTDFLKSRLQNPVAAAGLTAAVIAGAEQQSKAALMPDSVWDGTTLHDSAYQAMGTQMAGQYLLGFATNYSINGATVTDYTVGSATRLNSQYVLVAAHEITSFLQYGPTGYDVFTGNNNKTDRGTVDPVASVLIYPGADGSGDVPDIAILKLTEPLTGYSGNVLGSASPGDVVFGAGFGQAGTPSSGYISSANGPARSWNAVVWNQPPIDASSEYYQSTFFNDDFSETNLNGNAAPGDSGGPVVNSLGQLVGIDVAGAGYGGTIDTTQYQTFTDPTVYSWIVSNTQVPEPSTVMLLGAGATSLLVRRRRAEAK